MAPKAEKTRVPTHPPKQGTDCLHGQKCEVRTRFFCRVSGLFILLVPRETVSFFPEILKRELKQTNLGPVHTSHFCRVECNSNKR